MTLTVDALPTIAASMAGAVMAAVGALNNNNNIFRFGHGDGFALSRRPAPHRRVEDLNRRGQRQR